jgi:hypothetical protein
MEIGGAAINSRHNAVAGIASVVDTGKIDIRTGMAATEPIPPANAAVFLGAFVPPRAE